MSPPVTPATRLTRCCSLLLLSVCACSRGASDTSDDDRAVDPASALDAGHALDARVPVTTKHADASSSITPVAPGDLTRDCEPGTYTGAFTCQIDGVYPWGGSMSFSLVSTRVTGADIVYLEISPGTRISGADTMGGMFDATLAGMFDCASGTLTGSLQDGTYSSGFTGTISLAGDLTGQYVSATDAGVPGFAGAMGPLSNPDWDVLGPLSPNALCTWTAVRVGAAAANDAGTAP